MKFISSSLFKLSALSIAVGLASVACGGNDDPVTPVTLVGVEFTDTPVPVSDADMLNTKSSSSAIYKYSDGSSKTYPLSYTSLFKSTSEINETGGKKYASGQLFDVNMNPIMDPKGDPVVAETADANSLLKVGSKLFLVNHWEYDNILADGQKSYKVANWYSRMPMSMNLSEISQAADGKLSVISQKPVDFSSVNGGWIFCFGSQTPWNTHLGGEEDYDLYFVPGEKAYSTTTAGLKAMTEVYFNKTKTANPYHYGYATEVAVKEDGKYDVTKHYEMGRGTWEMAIYAKDGKTAFFGDDGSYSGMFMFVGNKANDPKAGGSIYAAKWNQTSADGSDANTTANITWIKLGSGTYDEVKALIDHGLTIGDIFETSLAAKDGFVPTRSGSAETIWLKLKPGMEKAAAYLETRRYAAYLGATTEFTKGEGVAINHADKKMYYALSYIQGSMLANDGGPVDDIRVKANNAGATMTFDMASSVKDKAGNVIASDYVPTKGYIEDMLLGRPITADAKGNTADTAYTANTDNVFFSEKLRTLFVGEDSGNHVNNFVWAYNVDTKKLTRLLSVAAGAEATGLQVAEDMNGHAYIMSNTQHQGDWLSTQPPALTTSLKAKAEELYGKNKYDTLNYYLQADVGYIGGMPAVK
ncbi:MAG: DUF839 domain-containing protein [Rhodoferax sp.]|uniref:PhoX family protein n=1 Tax=Rhodoferax sp. TaxID=50421 RepID=UPI001400A60B|nr:alkaline phosphatase PhoX [Rhodoferax sp.]NDP39842.1 DUF839 domain-containing protein [Rhodoferax sp.]